MKSAAKLKLIEDSDTLSEARVALPSSAGVRLLSGPGRPKLPTSSKGRASKPVHSADVNTPEDRKTYRREWMRKKGAEAKAAAA